MQFSKSLRALRIAGLGGLMVASIAACGGGSSNILSNVTPNAVGAQVRFVNGSSAANGPVDVVIDGSIQFHAVAYATAVNYISVGSGTHAVAIYAAGNESGNAILNNQSFSVNGSDYETLAIGGKTTPVFYALSDQVFQGTSTYAGYGAVNFYNIAPTDGAAGSVLGFYGNPQTNPTAPAITAITKLVQPASESNPVSVPVGYPIGFGAAAGNSTNAVATLTPSQIDPNGCSGNTFACNSGLASVFLIDGPKLIGIFNAPNQ